MPAMKRSTRGSNNSSVDSYYSLLSRKETAAIEGGGTEEANFDIAVDPVAVFSSAIVSAPMKMDNIEDVDELEKEKTASVNLKTGKTKESKVKPSILASTLPPPQTKEKEKEKSKAASAPPAYRDLYKAIDRHFDAKPKTRTSTTTNAYASSSASVRTGTGPNSNIHTGTTYVSNTNWNNQGTRPLEYIDESYDFTDSNGENGRYDYHFGPRFGPDARGYRSHTIINRSHGFTRINPAGGDMRVHYGARMDS